MVFIERYYDIAGCVIRVMADSKRAAQLWERLAPKYCLTPLAHEPDIPASGTLELYVQTPWPRVPLTGRRKTVEGGFCRANRTELWLEIGDSLVVVSPRFPNCVRLWFGASAQAAQSLTGWAALAYALPSLLRRSARYEMHAAGVVEPTRGQGLLLVGDSGSGKSTLTMRLAASGWSYLSDDKLVLGAEMEAVRVWGLRRFFSITAETQQMSAAASLGGPPLRAGEQYIFDPRQLFAAGNVASCVPRTLVFIGLTHLPESRLEPITASAAMLCLLRQSPWVCYDPVTSDDHTQMLAQLTKQCRAVRLHAGRDLLEQPEAAAQLLKACL